MEDERRAVERIVPSGFLTAWGEADIEEAVAMLVQTTPGPAAGAQDALAERVAPVVAALRQVFFGGHVPLRTQVDLDTYAAFVAGLNDQPSPDPATVLRAVLEAGPMRREAYAEALSVGGRPLRVRRGSKLESLLWVCGLVAQDALVHPLAVLDHVLTGAPLRAWRWMRRLVTGPVVGLAFYFPDAGQVQGLDVFLGRGPDPLALQPLFLRLLAGTPGVSWDERARIWNRDYGHVRRYESGEALRRAIYRAGLRPGRLRRSGP